MSKNGSRFRLDSKIFGVPTLLDLDTGGSFYFYTKQEARDALDYAKQHLDQEERITEDSFPDSINFRETINF